MTTTPIAVSTPNRSQQHSCGWLRYMALKRYEPPSSMGFHHRPFVIAHYHASCHVASDIDPRPTPPRQAHPCAAYRTALGDCRVGRRVASLPPPRVRPKKAHRRVPTRSTSAAPPPNATTAPARRGGAAAAPPPTRASTRISNSKHRGGGACRPPCCGARVSRPTSLRLGRSRPFCRH